jgi:hypothetical protein
MTKTTMTAAEKHEAEMQLTMEWYQGLVEHYTSQGLSPAEVHRAMSGPLQEAELNLAITRRYAIAGQALRQTPTTE